MTDEKNNFPRIAYYWQRPRSVLIGSLYTAGEQHPHDPKIPCARLCGMWMARAGFNVGSRALLEVTPGRVVMMTEEPVISAADSVFRPGWYRRDEEKDADRG